MPRNRRGDILQWFPATHKALWDMQFSSSSLPPSLKTFRVSLAPDRKRKGFRVRDRYENHRGKETVLSFP